MWFQDTFACSSLQMQILAESTPHAAELAAGRGTCGEGGGEGAESTWKCDDPVTFLSLWLRNSSLLIEQGGDSPAWMLGQVEGTLEQGVS